MTREYFHEHIGRHLIGAGAGSEYISPHKIFIPQRTSKDVKTLNLGQIGITYIACPEGSIIIGRLEHPSTPELQIIRSEDVSADKYMAHWLLNREVGGFMVGYIGKAAVESTFKLTHALARTTICDSSSPMMVNLKEVKETLKLIQDAGIPWKIFATALHTYAAYRAHQSNASKEKLNKQLINTPALRRVLPQCPVMTNSGEYKILSAYHIDR